MTPGEILLDPDSPDIEANVGRATTQLRVRHLGDRPIQVGSHFHFFEANRALSFDRAAAYGMRLNIPAGTAVRFEPGEDKEIALVALGGGRIMHGANALVEDRLDEEGARAAAMERIERLAFADERSSP